ncbi:MAG: LacI family DNA-binding transcriptional regulator [Armatimonadetes bacterium]|nr:LacI family DNA-binding transcriptional regulator [Armatimonadota bacterium]
MAKDKQPPALVQIAEEERSVAGMKEIAERVGVSKTTVHRALTGHGRISETTRARILKVAAELDYTPNILARSLRQQKTGTIGVITSGVASTFHSSLLGAIEEAASGQGFSLLLSVTGGRPDLEEHYLNVLREKRVDGLLISPSDTVHNVEHFERLKRADLPFVFFDRALPAVSADAVMTDHRLGGQLVAEHVILGGRKKIGLLSPALSNVLPSSVQERIAGIQDMAVQHGAQVTFMGLDGPWEPLEDYGAHSLDTFLDGGGDINALLAINDNYAIGALWACSQRALRVPEDLAIAGYDDLDVSSFVVPRLTTIRQPTRQVAWEAVKMLLSRMGGARPDEAVTIRLRPTLMERESTPRLEHPPSLTAPSEP